MPDGPGTHIDVTEWADIDAAPSVVDGREKDLVAQLCRNGLPHDYEHVVRVPDFKLEELDDEIAFVENSDRLAIGVCEDYSAKAWRLTQPHRRDDVADYGTYLPKSWTVVFETGEGIADLDSPQQGLECFAAGGLR